MKLSNILLIILTTILVVILFMAKGCVKPLPVHDKSDSLRAVIALKSDSIRLHEIKEKRLDSLSKISRIEYRYLKGKVINNPCDSEAVIQLVQKCDTIIFQDSSQIVALKSINHIQASIITDYVRVVTIKDSIILVKNDSLVVLNKKIKRIKKSRLLVGIGSFVIGCCANKL